MSFDWINCAGLMNYQYKFVVICTGLNYKTQIK